MKRGGNLANIVTALRLCAVPLLVGLVLARDFTAAAAVFAAAGLSDALDGWLARRFGGSALGAMLDPLADKALVIALMTTLAAIGALPFWLPAVVVARDMAVVGGVLVLRRRGPLRIAPLFVSKLNTALQLVLVGLGLVLLASGARAAGTLEALSWAVAATTLFSGAAYARMMIR